MRVAPDVDAHSDVLGGDSVVVGYGMAFTGPSLMFSSPVVGVVVRVRDSLSRGPVMSKHGQP